MWVCLRESGEEQPSTGPRWSKPPWYAHTAIYSVVGTTCLCVYVLLSTISLIGIGLTPH